MNYRGFITLLAILAIPKFGMADTVPTKGLSYDLKTAAACASDSPASGKFDLYEVGLFVTPKHPGVLGQLNDAQFKGSADGSQYTIQGTVSGINNINRVMSLTFDSNGTTIVLRNSQYTDAFCPVSGGKFSCSYAKSDNPGLSDSSKIMLLIYTVDGSLVVFNKTMMTKTVDVASQPATGAIQLSDRCVDLTLPSTSAATNQLTAVTFNRATTSDGSDVYLLNATFNAFVNGISVGQAGELVAVDNTTGKILTPKNTTMNNQPKCMPAMTGNVAHFNCIYPTGLNKISSNSQIYMMVLLPSTLTLYNTKVMTLADFATPAPAPTPPPQPAATCQAPTPVLGLDGSCTVSCGPNQTEDKPTASCKCSDGFTLDPQTKNACMAATPDASAAALPSFGHHCSLNPNATPNSQPQTILALLLMSMIAARAWHYSKN